jgi:hypothetical protein
MVLSYRALSYRCYCTTNATNVCISYVLTVPTPLYRFISQFTNTAWTAVQILLLLINTPRPFSDVATAAELVWVSFIHHLRNLRRRHYSACLSIVAEMTAIKARSA